MKLVAPAIISILSTLLCLCGCKKSSPPEAASSPSAENSAASNPAADNPKASGPASAPPGAVAVAPYNPKLKVPPPGPPVVRNGVTVNVQNAEKALATASWDANVALAPVRDALRYEDYGAALGHLQKAASDPSVNEAQKAAVAQVMQEVRQAAAAQPR